MARPGKQLVAIPRPLDMPLDGSNPFFQEHPACPAETTVFSVETDVTGGKTPSAKPPPGK
jgi:hypothetical protein